MDQPNQPLSGAEAIRLLKEDDAVFRAFDAYPWTKDNMFLSGLHAILGDPNAGTSLDSLRDMATHARIFYYAQRIGVTIDFARYQSWLEENHDHTIPDVLPDEYLLAAETRDKGKGPELSTPSLPWQDAAPKTALYVDRQAASASAAPGGGEPNYPMAFAEMLKLLQEGKPIPGIRQIPNTVIRDPSVKPVGSRPVPRKPWEKNDVASTQTIQPNTTLDTSFPTEDDETSAPPATMTS
ncbi:hypothetical protein S40285_03073 [Stachybotrys chlorohalonatus IBT 40285]|uniref:Uncharacterized protein n=1 Tax=Stachybotrys chlorohalonatus (strain IBT 40285) TaxID=1283841 RepID=A0A084QRN8_STAC4|nr:hypothetical protein S40285_03073 [Stachybotrys chlorohalonata IBT 40285]